VRKTNFFSFMQNKVNKLWALLEWTFVLHKIQFLYHLILYLVRYMRAKFEKQIKVYLTLNHLAVWRGQGSWQYTSNYLMISCILRFCFLKSKWYKHRDTHLKYVERTSKNFTTQIARLFCVKLKENVPFSRLFDKDSKVWLPSNDILY